MTLTIDFDVFKIEPGELMLDVGCGNGRHSLNTKCDEATVLSLDLSEESLNEVKYMIEGSNTRGGNRVHLLRGDALHLPLHDGSVDKIVCSEVLEHVPDDEGCIRELKRVLKPGGGLAISVPTRFSELIYDRLADDYLGKPEGHIRVYTRSELVEKLKKAGLQVWKTDTAHSLHFIYWLLRATFGIEEEDNLLPRTYHSFLNHADHSVVWQKIEDRLNGMFPKSIVVYAKKS